MNKKILVTGGMGFIGSHLAEKLAESGYKVFAFDSTRRWNLSGNIEYIHGDITNLKHVKRAVADKDGVIHLAALSKVSSGFEYPLECMKINVIGTMNILESVRLSNNRAWVILTSTRETSNDENSHSRAFRKITNLYGISKLTGEICGERYSIDYHTKVITLKLSDVYGSERDNPKKVFSKLILRALNHLDLLVQEGKQQFDFTHWQDVTNGFLLAIKKMESTKSHRYDDFAICTGKKTSLEELANLIVRETESNSRIIHFSLNVPPSHKYFSSAEKAKNILGFKAKIPLAAGIRKTVEIFREQLKLHRNSYDHLLDLL